MVVLADKDGRAGKKMRVGVGLVGKEKRSIPVAMK
jgi:hypothetical protein